MKKLLVISCAIAAGVLLVSLWPSSADEPMSYSPCYEEQSLEDCTSCVEEMIARGGGINYGQGAGICAEYWNPPVACQPCPQHCDDGCLNTPGCPCRGDE